jgi:hypothetical protein
MRGTSGGSTDFFHGFLAIKTFGAGHRDHAHGKALVASCGLRLIASTDFGAGGDDHRLGLAPGLGQDVAAARDVRRWCRVAPHCGRFWRDRKSAEGPSRVPAPSVQATCRFQFIAGTPDIEAGNHAQAADMLDRLVGRAVLAEADRIVGHHVDDALLHQRAHADGVARVVGEHRKVPP